MNWAYGVTTVEMRRTNLLPRTLASLREAGFDKPRLFVDGSSDPQSWCNEFQLGVTVREPVIRTFGNWILALAELYIRNPTADRFAMFQDDFVTYKNLRQYLEAVPYPDKSYLNLYTFPSNQKKAPKNEYGGTIDGFYEAYQNGRGAVALVFSNEAVRTLLIHQHIVNRPLDPRRGHRAIDGGIVTAMNKAGWKEYCHSPSLVQHTGINSSMGNRRHLLAESFRGENYDAMDLLKI